MHSCISRFSSEQYISLLIHGLSVRPKTDLTAMVTSIAPLNTSGLSVKRALSIAVQYDKLDKKYPDWALGLKNAYQDLDHIQRLLGQSFLHIWVVTSQLNVAHTDAFGYKEEDITILKDDHDGTTAPYPDTKTIVCISTCLVCGCL